MNNLMVIDGIEVRRDAYGRYSPERSASRSSSIWCKCQNQGAGESFFPANKLLSLFMN